MDEQLVLTAQTLRLNPHVQRAEVVGTAFVVKNVAARKYLTITTEQWGLLRNFANPATVPDVLRAVILSRSSLPLREYYELVLKALRAGILHIDRQPETEPGMQARRWMVVLGPMFPLVITWVSAAVALVALLIKPFPWPGPGLGGFLNIMIGWLLLIAGVSLGHVLAASVLRGGGGEVYSPRVYFWRPIPYFGVNLEDACMCSRQTQAGVWSVRLFPVLATAALLWWFRPEWGTLHVVALLVMLRPFDGGAVTNLLSTLCRGRVLDTQKNFLFSLNRRWRVELKYGLERVSLQYLAARLGWGLFWVVLVALVGLKTMTIAWADLFGSGKYWQEVSLVFGVIVFASIAAYLGPPMYGYIRWRSSGFREYFRRLWKRWRLSNQAPVPEEQITRTMAESMLFRRLPPAERAALSSTGQMKYHKAFSTVQKFSDDPKFVSLILSGQAIVYRRLKSGRPERTLLIREGDLFGLDALIDPDRPQALVRARTPLLVLTIPIREFQRRVVATLGVPLTTNLVQRVPFLRELKFCANWHPQALARFAQLATLVTYRVGEVIVSERQDSQQFFVIYEGRVVVTRAGRKVTRLRSGAFFGEISLLQNSTAVSDVAAQDETRCFSISKTDFLRFVTHNPNVAIQLEQISSKRLGRPVFPCDYRSFDVRGR